ncbi:MAG: hypothetical protein JOZ47_17590 [Kutzneria sp.]|nr:hypothetical protein [Kutzneria sp.]MBV9846859.1 hypothetical protein [Kutzneria sp.]
MSRSDDPERLLAEALRAQAVSSPVPMTPLPEELGEPHTGEAEPAGEEAGDEEAGGPETGGEYPTETDTSSADDEQGANDRLEPDTPETAATGDESEHADNADTDNAEASEPGPGGVELTEEMMLRALTEGPITTELATIRIERTHHVETERFSPVENVLGPVGEGPGFGLLSGTEVGSVVGPAVDEPAESSPRSTRLMPTPRVRLGVGPVLVLAVALGLAAGVVAALLSML